MTMLTRTETIHRFNPYRENGEVAGWDATVTVTYTLFGRTIYQNSETVTHSNDFMEGNGRKSVGYGRGHDSNSASDL